MRGRKREKDGTEERFLLEIRSTREQNGRVHVHADIVEIMAQIYRVPINFKIYPPHEKTIISRLVRNCRIESRNSLSLADIHV